MPKLNQEYINQMIQEIKTEAEVTRRALMKRRHDIYQDNGKKFLLEQLEREFSRDAIKEMRVAPINFLKKIVDKRSNLYKSPGPTRTAVSGLESDQALIDYYVYELDLNEKMDKANRYFTLFSNCVLYCIPVGDSVDLRVIPPYLYSVKPNPIDRCKADCYVFNAFLEGGRVTRLDDVPSATGVQGFSRQVGSKASPDLIDSQERDEDIGRQYIFWSDESHITVNEKGESVYYDATKGTEQYDNPILEKPIINLAKDRDNEFWATQFGDTVDLGMALMLGWSDLLSISKMQGWSQLVITSSEEPKQLTVGITKVVWLKQKEGLESPTMQYVNPSSPLSQYKENLMDLLALMLSTANLNPKEIGGANSGARNYSSGFQALIESADILEARKMDINPMRKAEEELWEVIGKWHNYMFDTGILSQEARALGKFSEDMEISIAYPDVKPIESEQERVALVKELMGLGLLTKKDALKKLHPDLADEEIDGLMKEIDDEKSNSMDKAIKQFDQMQPPMQPMGDEPNGFQS